MNKTELIAAMADQAGLSKKDAEKALEHYLNGEGKKAKDIDAAYSLADSKYKAKKLEEERQRNNNS